MFSSIFGKRRSSPVEESQVPPIPTAKSDDEYVMVNPSPARGGMYPNISGAGTPYPTRPAPTLPKMNSTDQNFNYMQGVPFSLSRDLQLASRKDTLAVEIGDLLAYATNKINLSKFEYDFSIEKSVLKEC